MQTNNISKYVYLPLVNTIKIKIDRSVHIFLNEVIIRRCIADHHLRVTISDTAVSSLIVTVRVQKNNRLNCVRLLKF